MPVMRTKLEGSHRRLKVVRKSAACQKGHHAGCFRMGCQDACHGDAGKREHVHRMNTQEVLCGRDLS